MSEPNFYAVRLSNRKFQAANGAVDSVAQANQFPDLEKAYEAASANDEAAGVSEYTSILSPVRHLTLDDVESELNQEEGE